MSTFLLVIASYLVGSVPTSQITARLLKGIDLRQYGSGTVSGTGVYYHVARWAVVPVGLFDIAKGAVPTWLGLHFGLGLPTAALAGLAAVVGHDWPLYLGLRGGRGISPFMGLLLVIFPWGFPWLLAAMALGRLLAATAEVSLLGIATLPLLTWITGQAPTVTVACLGMLFLTLVKRLEANREPLPTTPAERRQVILRRLLMDRDVGRREPWVHRQPVEEGQEGI